MDRSYRDNRFMFKARESKRNPRAEFGPAYFDLWPTTYKLVLEKSLLRQYDFSLHCRPKRKSKLTKEQLYTLKIQFYFSRREIYHQNQNSSVVGRAHICPTL